ncbi:hypothetical protein SLS57_012117 [Botryosphaeria dothidea]
MLEWAYADAEKKDLRELGRKFPNATIDELVERFNQNWLGKSTSYVDKKGKTMTTGTCEARTKDGILSVVNRDEI